MLNPNGSTCKDDNCLNQLSWESDGSLFSNRYASKINMNLGTLCVVYKANSGNAVAKPCTDLKKFACQFSCESGRSSNHIIRWSRTYRSISGVCPSGSDNKEVPQGGYVYIGSTGKYYRPRNSQQFQINFQDALKECHKEGATLIEYQTAAEFQVAKRMMGKVQKYRGHSNILLISSHIRMGSERYVDWSDEPGRS